MAELVASGAATRGIVIDGAGIGSSMAANKVPGIRAALCYDKASARNSREHNDSNVLTLGARLLTETQAEEVLRTWIGTPFAGGRHQARVQKILDIEQRIPKETIVSPAELDRLVAQIGEEILARAERADGGSRKRRRAQSARSGLPRLRAALPADLRAQYQRDHRRGRRPGFRQRPAHQDRSRRSPP